MTTERRSFRPFDVPSQIASFLAGAHLQIGEERMDAIENGSRQIVDAADLRRGDLSVGLANNDEEFDQLKAAALEAAWAHGGEDALEFAVIVSSGYLKLADIVVRTPLAEVERINRLADGVHARALDATHHGCDVDAFVALAHDLPNEPLRPWRRGTWLSRAHFELRTGLEGLGLTLLPLTDSERQKFGLPAKTLRYTSLEESPVEADSAAGIIMYVDEDLLARLNKSPRRDWARAFADQLAVDVLTAIALRALADEQVREVEWATIRSTLLGSLIAMVAGHPTDPDKAGADLLEMLRTDPLKFLTRIEGACAMRDAGKFIVGGGS